MTDGKDAEQSQARTAVAEQGGKITFQSSILNKPVKIVCSDAAWGLVSRRRISVTKTDGRREQIRMLRWSWR